MKEPIYNIQLPKEGYKINSNVPNPAQVRKRIKKKK